MFIHIIWDLDEEPGGNVQKIDEHDLTIEEVEEVLEQSDRKGASRSSSRPCVYGWTSTGKYIVVFYDRIDDDTIYPVTAYEVPEPH